MGGFKKGLATQIQHVKESNVKGLVEKGCWSFGEGGKMEKKEMEKEDVSL